MNGLFERLLIAIYFLRYRYFLKFQTRAHLEQWQQRRMKLFEPWLRTHSTFYRERLSSGWQNSPIIDKAVMMSHFDELNTAGLKREEALNLAIRAEQSRDFTPMIGEITIGLSSGTSGSRGLFCAGFLERAQYAGAILAKALPSNGVLQTHRVAFFLRANSNLYETVGGRRLRFQYFDLLTDLREHVRRLNAYQPTLVIAPPSLLRQLAAAIQQNALRLSSVARVFSVAEVLDPIDQKHIEQAFGQKVHQIYQCTEGFLAISCPHGEIHLNEDLVIIEKEWLDRAQHKFVPIVTDLNRRTQPILRYRLNDILTENPEPCACGSVMTRLRWIEGRCDDMLVFVDPHTGGGKTVFPDFIRNSILYSSDQISEYLVTQMPDARIRIALKTQSEAISPQTLEGPVTRSLEALAQRLGLRLPPVKFEHHFPELKSTKLRRIIQQMKAPYDTSLPSSMENF